LGDDAGTIEEVYEPFLIKEGFIKRTPRGREATELALYPFGDENEQKNKAPYSPIYNNCRANLIALIP